MGGGRRVVVSRACSLAALLVLSLPPMARAQATPQGVTPPQGRALETSAIYFAEAWDFNGRPAAALMGGSVAVAVTVHGRWAAVIEGLALTADERRTSTFVGGVSVMLRRTIAQHGPTAFFLEAGAGASYASKPVPANGTRFNYPLQAGGGFSRRFTPRVGALLSLRLFHLSNKSLNGPSHNPDIEALGGHVGIYVAF